MIDDTVHYYQNVVKELTLLLERRRPGELCDCLWVCVDRDDSYETYVTMLDVFAQLRAQRLQTYSQLLHGVDYSEYMPFAQRRAVANYVPCVVMEEDGAWPYFYYGRYRKVPQLRRGGMAEN